MWGLEVAEDSARQLLDAVEERPDGDVHLVAAGDDLVGEVAFEVGVDQFVGVEVRGVRGQEVQLDPCSVNDTPNNLCASSATRRNVHNIPPRSSTSGDNSTTAPTSTSVCDGDNFVFSPAHRPGRPDSKPATPPAANRLRQLRIRVRWINGTPPKPDRWAIGTYSVKSRNRYAG